jgi:integrase
MSVRKPKKGKSFEVDFYQNGKRIRKAGFKTKSEAIVYERKVLSLRDSGVHLNVTEGKTLIKDLYEMWIELKKRVNKPKTIENCEVAWSAWIEPTFGNLQVRNVNMALVRHWASNIKLKSGELASRETCNRAFNVLSQILELAVESNAIISNPARNLTLKKQNFLPKRVKKEVKAFTVEQIFRILDKLNDYKVFVLIQVLTSIRSGEACALRIRDLDFENGIISINKSVSIVRGKLVEGTPKNNTARTVQMPDFIKDELLIIKSLKSKNDLIFTTPNGHQINMHNFRKRVWNPLMEELGFEGYTPHTLRKSATSLAISLGANILAVSELAGHSDFVVTVRNYGHLYKEDSEAVTTKLDREFRKHQLQRNTSEITELSS